MFSSTAELYDTVYGSFKDYPAEAERIAALLRELHPGAHMVLDVACGTAEHARLLAGVHGYRVDGIDLDPSFVRIAREKLGDAAVTEADMTAFDLGRRYDVVLCLFSSIGYVRTREALLRALGCFRRHLADGGVALVEPWLTPEAVVPGLIHLTSVESPELTVSRMSVVEVDGRDSRLRFEYLIGRDGAIERAAEVHALGLFTVEEMRGAFRDAGFEVSFDPVGLIGRGLYVARAA
jgi:SAM-dependent methyltransferase